LACGEGEARIRGFAANRVAPFAHRWLSHKIMKKDGWPDYPFSFHDSEELGPAILSKISKKTGLQPRDL